MNFVWLDVWWLLNESESLWVKICVACAIWCSVLIISNKRARCSCLINNEYKIICNSAVKSNLSLSICFTSHRSIHMLLDRSVVFVLLYFRPTMSITPERWIGNPRRAQVYVLFRDVKIVFFCVCCVMSYFDMTAVGCFNWRSHTHTYSAALFEYLMVYQSLFAITRLKMRIQ